MKELLAVAFGGAFGASARYGVAIWAKATMDGSFPWGTWLVNMSGSLLLGFFLEWSMEHPDLSTTSRLVIATGFFGAFTTFSTFTYDTVDAAILGHWGLAAGNIAANLLVGLTFAYGGIQLARWLS